MPTIPPEPPGGKPPNRRPKREDFATVEEYAKAFMDWRSHQAEATRDAEPLKITSAPKPPPPSSGRWFRSPSEAPPEVTDPPKYPLQAAHLEREMWERGWKIEDLIRESKVDRKTIRKILDGYGATVSVWTTIVSTLEKYPDRPLRDVPRS